MTVVSDMVITMSNPIVAIETVTLPAGSYDEAYRVEAETSMAISTAGFATSMTFPVTQWFVRGIGLVKTFSTFEGSTSVVELLSLERK